MTDALAASGSTRGAGLQHPALFYRSTADYAGTLGTFVRDGVRDDEPVLVAVPAANLDVLREECADVADEVTWLDMEEAGRNPGRILPLVLTPFVERHAHRSVRIIGEPMWAGRSPAAYAAAVEHEALINLALAGADTTIVCPYDTTTLPASAIEDARRTHPELWSGSARESSAAFDVDGVRADHGTPSSAPTTARSHRIADVRDLARLRQWARTNARDLGATDSVVARLLLVVSELATNALVHGDGGCRVDVWRHASDLVCAARDEGRLTDPLAGRRPVREDSPTGRGLVLVQQLADVVRVHGSPEGTTVEARLELP